MGYGQQESPDTFLVYSGSDAPSPLPLDWYGGSELSRLEGAEREAFAARIRLAEVTWSSSVRALLAMVANLVQQKELGHYRTGVLHTETFFLAHPIVYYENTHRVPDELTTVDSEQRLATEIWPHADIESEREETEREDYYTQHSKTVTVPFWYALRVDT